jgi:hypothetical protein
MKVQSWASAAVLPLLAACTEYEAGTSDASAGFIQSLPEGVVAIAAPYQDLNAVRIDPSDGCYVYRYIGPVETTYLPLRTSAGNPICTRQPVIATSG